MKITNRQLQALRIIREKGPLRPREFARFMWPESQAWSHSVKCGNGAHRGGGMHLAGGGYLGKLARLGLIRRSVLYPDKGYILTPAGNSAVQESGNE